MFGIWFIIFILPTKHSMKANRVLRTRLASHRKQHEPTAWATRVAILWNKSVDQWNQFRLQHYNYTPKRRLGTNRMKKQTPLRKGFCVIGLINSWPIKTDQQVTTSQSRLLHVTKHLTTKLPYYSCITPRGLVRIIDSFLHKRGEWFCECVWPWYCAVSW